MFITRTDRQVTSFYLSEKRDMDEFHRLLNDPAITVIDKKYLTETETSYEGESSVIIEKQYVRVEYEVCSL